MFPGAVGMIRAPAAHPAITLVLFRKREQAEHVHDMLGRPDSRCSRKVRHDGFTVSAYPLLRTVSAVHFVKGTSAVELAMACSGSATAAGSASTGSATASAASGRTKTNANAAVRVGLLATSCTSVNPIHPPEQTHVQVAKHLADPRYKAPTGLGFRRGEAERWVRTNV
jgi:hypothetical protein